MKRAALLLVLLAGCEKSGTGVLLTVEGPTLQPQPNLLAIVASFGTHVVPRTIELPNGLPTTVLAELPDENTNVTFDVTARRDATVLAHDTTPGITVSARQIATASITLGGGGDGGGGDGGNLPWTVQQGGEPLAPGTVTGLWGPSGGEVYATSTLAGGTNLLRSVDHGAAWQPQLAGGMVDLHAVAGTSSSDVYLVGDGATILHGSGTSWSPESAPVSSSTKLFGVFVVNGTPYACGSGNAVLKSSGGWILQTTVGTTELHAVWGVPGHVWVVGSGGTILHSPENNTWTPQTSGTALSLNTVFGTSATDIWAVGDGVVLHSTGNGSWAPMSNGIPAGTSLSAVTAAPGGALFVAGGSFGIFRLDAGSFVAEPTGLTVVDPSQDRLFALFAPSSSEVFAGGAGRTLLHRP